MVTIMNNEDILKLNKIMETLEVNKTITEDQFIPMLPIFFGKELDIGGHKFGLYEWGLWSNRREVFIKLKDNKTELTVPAFTTIEVQDFSRVDFKSIMTDIELSNKYLSGQGEAEAIMIYSQLAEQIEPLTNQDSLNKWNDILNYFKPYIISMGLIHKEDHDQWLKPNVTDLDRIEQSWLGKDNDTTKPSSELNVDTIDDDETSYDDYGWDD